MTLPQGARVEVYNAGQRLTKRFVATSFEELKQQLNDAFGGNRDAVIEDFLKSYRETGGVASLTAARASLTSARAFGSLFLPAKG